MQSPTDFPRQDLTLDYIQSVLSGAQNLQIAWGMDLLDSEDKFVEDISPWLVLEGSYVKRQLEQEIPGSCTFQVTKDLLWGEHRVRPKVTVSAPVRVAGTTWETRSVESRLGIYLLNTPEIVYGDLDVPELNTYQVEAMSKLELLNQPFDGAIEVDDTTPLLRVIELLIAMKDPNSERKVDNTKGTVPHPNGKVWEARDESTALAIINDLLQTLAYAPLSDDHTGAYVINPLVEVSTRRTEWVYRFDDPESVIALPLTAGQDFFQLPNKWIFYADDPNNELPEEGSGQYTVKNQDDGPTSIDARKREITTKRNLDAVDQEALEEQGKKIVSDEVRGVRRVQFPVALNPLHWGYAKYGDMIGLKIPGIQLDADHEVVEWTMPMDGQDMELVAIGAAPIKATYGPPAVDTLSADFTYDADRQTDFEVAFTDTTVGAPDTWAWDFTNNGSTDSTEQNPIYVFPGEGTYTTRLFVQDSGSDSEVLHTVVVPPATNPTNKLKVITGLQKGASKPNLTRAVNLGCSWVRAGFDMSGFIQNGSTGNPLNGVNWDYGGIETYYDDAISRGISILATPTYLPNWMTGRYHEVPKVAQDVEDYADALAGMVAHYGSKVSAWEIWNEANHGPFNWDAKVEDYRYLLRRCIIKMRAVDPDVVIISSGPASRTSSANQWVAQWDQGSTARPYPPDPTVTYPAGDYTQTGPSMGTFLNGLFDATTGIVPGSTPGTPYVSGYGIHCYIGNKEWSRPYFEAPLAHIWGLSDGSKVQVGSPYFNFWDDIIAVHESPGHGKKIWMTEGGFFAGSTELTEADAAVYMKDYLIQWGIRQVFGQAGPVIYYEEVDRAKYGASGDSHDYYGLYKINPDDTQSKKATWDVLRQAFLGFPI